MAKDSPSIAAHITTDCTLMEGQVPASDSAAAGASVHRTSDNVTWRMASMRAFHYVGEANLALVVLTLTYIFAIANSFNRKMWYDELFTYYISQAPTLSRLRDTLAHTDLNPVLHYLLVRASQSIFGASEFATRLPAALGFYVGSISAFAFLKRRIGVMWSAVAILAFWSTPYLRYATEARPYGLLLGFFGITLAAYGQARAANRSAGVLFGIAAGSTGMMLSHVFAPLSILPFCVAEAVRGAVRRRIDWPVCAALALPVSMSVIYLPTTSAFQLNYFPQAFQASWEQNFAFFTRLSFLYAWPAIAACILAFLAIPYSSARRQKVHTGWPGIGWAASLLLVPVMLNFVLSRSQGPFYERYCITTAFGFYMLAAIALGWATGFRRSSAGAAALTLCILTLVVRRPPNDGIPDASALRTIRQDLPLVAANGLTFLELDHYESESFKSRLYYLVDRDAAIRYAHSTVFENFPLLTRYFPIRAHVEPYDAFVAVHKHFMVLTRADYHGLWVLEKLRQDGARITLTRLLSGPVKEAQLYEVQR